MSGGAGATVAAAVDLVEGPAADPPSGGDADALQLLVAVAKVQKDLMKHRAARLHEHLFARRADAKQEDRGAGGNGAGEIADNIKPRAMISDGRFGGLLHKARQPRS